MNRLWVGLRFLAVEFAFLAGSAGFAGPTVGVLLGDATSPFGKELAKQLPVAAEAHGLTVVVRAPPVAESVPQMERLLHGWQSDSELRGLVVACGLGGAGLAKETQPFAARAVPVVALLGRMPPGAAKSTILVDENTLIAAAVDHAAALLQPGDEVALLRSNLKEGQMNDRERQFIVGLHARRADVPVRADVFMNADGSTPEQQARMLLEKHPNVRLVYSPYTTATVAMVAALRATGLAGKVHHVGIGAGLSPELSAAIERGELDALVAMSPSDIASKTAETMAAVLAGKPVPEVVYSQVQVITKASLATAK